MPFARITSNCFVIKHFNDIHLPTHPKQLTNHNYSAIHIDIAERRVQKAEKSPRVTVRTDQICISRTTRAN